VVVLFHYLSALNIFDALVTYFGLKNALIEEMNPLMNHLYEAHPVLFIFIKLAFSVCLYLFIVFKTVPRSSLTKGLTICASSFYTVVFILHCSWLVEHI
jgi:hypothetical protein